MAWVNKDFVADLKSWVPINEILQVRIADDPDSVTHYSRVNDISDGKLVIAWPTQGGIRLLVRKDQILLFCIMREAIPHEFTGLVDDTDASAALPQITIIVSSPVSRIQRRQHFRIKAMIPVEIVGQIKNPKDNTVEALELRTTTFDISAGGIGIRHSKHIPEDILIEIRLALPDGAPPIKIPCRVVYSDDPAENKTLYHTGIRFLAVSESERARIVRYVYKTQLKGLHP